MKISGEVFLPTIESLPGGLQHPLQCPVVGLTGSEDGDLFQLADEADVVAAAINHDTQCALVQGRRRRGASSQLG